MQFYKYNFSSFARSTTEQMPALVYYKKTSWVTLLGMKILHQGSIND
jgi:hypothetical protein